MISENPLASPSKEEIPDLDEECDKRSSPAKSKFIDETPEQGFERRVKNVQQRKFQINHFSLDSLLTLRCALYVVTASRRGNSTPAVILSSFSKVRNLPLLSAACLSSCKV